MVIGLPNPLPPCELPSPGGYNRMCKKICRKTLYGRVEWRRGVTLVNTITEQIHYTPSVSAARTTETDPPCMSVSAITKLIYHVRLSALDQMVGWRKNTQLPILKMTYGDGNQMRNWPRT
jgi:hypothetical protein